MSSNQSELANDVHESLSALQISDDNTLPEGQGKHNPWQDPSLILDLAGSSPTNPVVLKEDKLSEDELSQPNPFAAATVPVLPPKTEEEEKDVLQEFDPLANQVEKDAREAWETAESHPSPQVKPGQVGPADSSVPSTPEIAPHRSSSPIPAFPALAALARTFALPLGVRTRPRSLDSAAAVPSPATLSSFATQQQAPPKPGTEPSPSSTGRNTPVRTSSNGPREGSLDPPQFDFQRFLDQMKFKGAEPVAKYLRSFLSNFAKRNFTVPDQVKLISDFLNFIAQRMRESDVWKNVSDAEFDNSMEGMEKLVMNRLYDFTFTPQVAKQVPPRPVTADDLEKDRVLSQRIALFTWVEPKHLEISVGDGSEGFMMFAQQELLKINHYKAPRDKLICVLNCCKVIFGLLRHLRKEEGADSFVPILIYVVLKANPDHLLSNVEFINRFRNPAKLQSEAGYYLSSLMGAVSFIETMDHTSLSSITQEEFENNVEEAIHALATSEPPTPSTADSESPFSPIHSISSHAGEEAAQPLSLQAPGISEDARRFLQKTGDTISKPLNAIGRIFNEVLDNAEESLASLPSPFAQLEQLTAPMPHTPATYSENGSAIQTPYKPRIRPSHSPQPSRYGTPIPEETPTRQGGFPGGPYTNQPLFIGPSQPATRFQTPPAPHPPHLHSLAQSERDLQRLQLPPGHTPHASRTSTPILDLAGLQDEIDRVHESAVSAARETLKQIFPGVDEEVLELVLEANDNDLGRSIEALLEMSGGN